MRPWRPLSHDLPTAVWWDNWAHNAAVSLIVFPALAGLAVLLLWLLLG